MQYLFGLFKSKAVLEEEGIFLSLIPPGGGLTAWGFRKVDSAEVVIRTPAEIVVMRSDRSVNHLSPYEKRRWDTLEHTSLKGWP